MDKNEKYNEKLKALAMKIRLRLSGVKDGNYEPNFNLRFNNWQYKLSDKRELLNGDLGLTFDKEGNITNAKWSKVSENGLELTKERFVQQELEYLEKVNRELLKPHERLNFDEYMRYVKNVNTRPGNPHPKIFVGIDNTNFEKFDYLFNELSLAPPTKLSALYHYFKEGNLFQPNMTQSDYLIWCEKTYEVEFSRIFQLNHKTEDVIKITIPSLLSNLKKPFDETH